MEQKISEYITKVTNRYKTGISREHAYRGDLQYLLELLVPEIIANNDPAQISCGAPDYIITRNNIPIGYIEAKDIGSDLYSKAYKEQFDRYKSSLENLIFTDYLDYHFYIDGEFVTSIRIAEIQNNKLIPLTNNFATFINLIRNFTNYQGQTIKSPKRLAEMMAGKARILSDVIGSALLSDEQNKENSTLKDQLYAFQQILMHDINSKEFADIYAQTIAYGMFAARIQDKTIATFTRQEAAILIPKSNPFLRKLFQYIAGYDLDSRIIWIVDGLADIFRATDVNLLLKHLGKSNLTHDPIIHFYETFLSEYDPKLRKSMGVWYTPAPVVSFITRAVDDILKTEFNLKQGLADTSKIKIKVQVLGDAKNKEEKEVHKIQILDPATGTGTFLAEVIRQIYQKFSGQQGIWSNYVENHLIPRLNGFEILMASYAMAHLKLEMLLEETGYKPLNDQRLKIFLTNSLEEYHPDTGNMFAGWLSDEANEANHIKRDNPVMVILGNPPYSISSNNKSDWILDLIKDYKKDLNEKKTNLDDDYIKFIKFGQHYIDKNGEGVLAYITNNSFINGVTHRQMRKNLLESFDKIYVLNLHGNSKKTEHSPDGSIDENVFDIMQGVSINIFVKTGIKKKNKIGEIFHFDVFGKREYKYEYLQNNQFYNIKWNKIETRKPYYFFIPQNIQNEKEYLTGFKINQIFLNYNTGIQTKRDALTINFTRLEAESTEIYIKNHSESEIRNFYNLPDDGRDWTVANAKKDLNINPVEIHKILYRPFDIRYILYTGKTKGIVAYPRNNTSRHLLNENISLITMRINGENEKFVCLLSNTLVEKGSLPSSNYSFFPLYLYSENKSNENIFAQNLNRESNLNPDIIHKISEALNLKFTNEKGEMDIDKVFDSLDVFDYIYAILHSPTYRAKYKEFLKIDFPYIPYPKDILTFWNLVKLGGELRETHLLKSPIIENFISEYPVDGTNLVEKVFYDNNKIYINSSQYFSNVPASLWNSFIGGYQPAQKWLKDRKNRVLSFDDILHYQKIIVALSETDRIMKEIDQLKIQ